MKLFRDAVHGFVEIPRDTLLPLVDTPEFQRLRRLTQLGTSSITYPCGEHSRFQHSLGVAHLFQIMAAEFSAKDTPLSEEEHLVGGCAALLHDIGHGPFSHALEGIFSGKKNHEEWTQDIILSDESVVNQRLNELDTDLPAKVADVIGKRHPSAILVAMISSQLDVDRMDYLLRDSQCVGVPYGDYDADRLIKMLQRNGDRIVVDRRGLMNAEAYLFARYHMYWQVYFHPTTRGYERLLKAALRRAKSLHGGAGLQLSGISSALRAVIAGNSAPPSLHDYLALDNHDLFVALKEWRKSDDETLSDLCRRLLDRDLLKPVEIRTDELWGAQERAREAVRQAGYDPDYYLLMDRSADVAYDYYTEDEGEGTKPSILVERFGGSPVEISRESNAVAAIARKRQVRVVIYVPQECRHGVRQVVGG